MLSRLGEVDIAAEMGDRLLAALFLIHIKTINFGMGKRGIKIGGRRICIGRRGR